LDQPQEEQSISKAPIRPLKVDALAASVIASLDGDKAEEIVTIDLRGRSNIADTMVVATGRSARQVGAMADHLIERLKGAGISASVEGMGHGDWVLIDAGDVIVHLFRPEVREFYDLEGMWLEPADGSDHETQRA
jgi:ribosome-associated protein